MRRRSFRNSRAGALLDGIVGLSIVVLGAYALDRLGLSFVEIVHGASHFFGV